MATTIAVSYETKEALRKPGEKGESYDNKEAHKESGMEGA